MMRFKVLPVLVAAGILLPLTAGAAIDQMWAKHYASVSNVDELDHFVSVVTDRQGNVYTAGTSHDTLSDTTCYIITKYNEWARKLWRTDFKYLQYDFESAYIDSVTSSPLLAIDNANGYLYLAATERWWPPEGVWSHRVRIVKYALNTGAVVWSETLFVGNPNGWIDDYVSGMAFDTVNNSLYLCATTWHDHQPGAPGDTYNYDWGIVRVDPNDGNALWKAYYGQAQDTGAPGAQYTDFATGIAIGPGKDPVVCGACYNPTSTYYNWGVARFDRATGALAWVNPWHSSGLREDNEEPWAICANDSGIYAAGYVYSNLASVYGYALVKFLPDSTSRGSDYGFAFDEGYLRAATHTTANGGRVYAVGTVWNNLSNSSDWFTVACSTGLRPTDFLTEKWQALLDTAENDDYATAVRTDSLGRPWVMGSVDLDTTIDWVLRRYNPANGVLLAPDLGYHRNIDWDNLSVPTSFAVRDTKHIYMGGFTVDDSFNSNHTVVRFSAKIPSAVLDSLRDSTFAWRDTVDTGATVRPRAYYHNNGYSLAMPKIRTAISPFYADSIVDTVGAPPDSARTVLMPAVWTALQRGLQTMTCTLDLAGDTSPGNNRRTRNVFVRVSDVGPEQIILADTFEEGATITPQASVRNHGNVRAASFQVTFEVGDSWRIATVSNLPRDSVRLVTFGSLTLSRGTYRVRVYTDFAGDRNRSNDTLVRPDSLFIRYRDVSCRGILAPGGSYRESLVVTPSAAFKNLGNVTADFWTHFKIPAPTDVRAGVECPQPNAERRISGFTPALVPVAPAKLPAAGNKRLSTSPQSEIAGLPKINRAVQPRPSFGIGLAPSFTRYLPRVAQDAPYHDSLLVTLAPGESAVRAFPDWTATPSGNYRADCYTLLANDRNRNNDTAHSVFTVGTHDVGVAAILAPRDTVPAGNLTPRATVHNYGSLTESFRVYFRILGGTPYADSVALTLARGRDSTVSFRAWAASLGTYTTRCSTWLASDVNPINDTAGNSFVVVRHDVGVASIVAPRDTVVQSVVTPQAHIGNYGSITETFKVFMRITGGAPWADSLALTLASGRDSLVSFRDWNTSPGSYAARCSTGLAADANRRNDTLSNRFVVVVHDVGVVAILAPRGALDSGTSVVPQAVVRNLGSVAESFRVRFRIGSVYSDSQPVSLAAGAVDTVLFAGWIAGPVGLHVTTCSTMLAGDGNPANDRVADSVRVLPVEGLEEAQLGLPRVFVLDEPRPNPFGAQTVIRYGLPRETPVAVDIYSATGELVRSVYRGRRKAGYYSAFAATSALPEGIYYCRLVADGFRAVRKLVKVR